MRLHRRGLNLTEVMLAVGILSIALLALIGVFTTGLTLLSQSRDSQTATQLARELIEQTRAGATLPTAPTVFDGSVPTPVVSGFPPPPYPSRNVGGATYTFLVTCQPVRADLIAVAVEVRWNSHRIRTESCYYVP